MPEHVLPDWLEGSSWQRDEPLWLTAQESEVLRAALAPLLRDLAATSAVVPEIAELAWDIEPDSVTALIGRPHHAQGIRVRLDLPSAERLADLADQVQEWEVEALWLDGGQATWPECPEHPRSHPLAARLDGRSEAVWQYPKSGHVVSAIGSLRR